MITYTHKSYLKLINIGKLFPFRVLHLFKSGHALYYDLVKSVIKIIGFIVLFTCNNVGEVSGQYHILIIIFSPDWKLIQCIYEISRQALVLKWPLGHVGILIHYKTIIVCSIVRSEIVLIKMNLTFEGRVVYLFNCFHLLITIF